jgi:hypothetical protein
MKQMDSRFRKNDNFFAVAAGGRNEETNSNSLKANIKTVSEQKAAQANKE